MQFFRLHENITRKDIIQNDVLDKIIPVIFFIIILLDGQQGNGQNATEFCGQLIGSFYKNRIIRLDSGAERLIGISVLDKNFIPIYRIQGDIVIVPANFGQVAAGNYHSRVVNDTDNPINGIPHLMYYTLKQSV